MKKTIFRLFIVVNLILVFVGCKTQQVTPTNKALYHKSLENLDAKNFVIKIIEFYDKGSEKYSNLHLPLEGYVSVKGDKSVLRLSKDLPYSSSYGSSFVEDNSSQLINKKKNKKGDTLFDLKINGGEVWLIYTLQVTLYKNSNQCFVQIKNMWDKEFATFKGQFTQ